MASGELYRGYGEIVSRNDDHMKASQKKKHAQSENSTKMGYRKKLRGFGEIAPRNKHPQEIVLKKGVRHINCANFVRC